ncbi:MAG: hypothetical protein K2H85_00645, partial [Allobaculum sp.]|nr:hypothetical protein [Allobaculum sp.]
RVANAAMKQAKTRREALKALKKIQITELESKINSYQELISQKVSKHNEWHATINWLKPPKGACNQNNWEKKKIFHMKMRLRKMKQKLQRWKAEFENEDFGYCFGSKKLFKAQFFLEENGFSDHQDWKKAWQKARTTSFFLIGSSDETNGNQLCQLVPSSRAKTKGWYILKLRSGFRGDDTLYCIPMYIPYLNEQLSTNIEDSSVSYHIVLKDHGIYLQPCIQKN